MLRRRPEQRVRPPPQPTYIDFQPPKEWLQEPSNYILSLHLPGFKKEDINVTSDKSGKITVRGRKQLSESRFSRFEESYDVPKDSNLEKIRGKLEDGFLALAIPRIVTVEPEKTVLPSEEKKEEPAIEEKPKIAAEERGEEEAPKEIIERPTVPKEKPMMAGEERKEAAVLNEMKVEPTLEEKPKMPEDERKEEASLKEIKEEPTKPEMANGERIKEAAALKELNERSTLKEPKMASWDQAERKDEAAPTEMKEELTVKEKLNMDEKTREEAAQKKPNTMEEKKEETIQKDKPEGFDREKTEESDKKEEPREEAMPKKPRYCYEAGVQEKQPKDKESRKRRWLWNEGDKGWLDWLDSAFIDDLLKKVYNNKKFITVALVAFSTGFYISRKLRTRG